MPSPQSISKALHLLTAQASWMGDKVIDTHRLDKDGELKNAHRCFNGSTVADVLVLNDSTVFDMTDEAKIIVGMVATWIEMRHTPPNACEGFVNCEDIQGVIESTLFQLEKAYIQDAAPQIVAGTSSNEADMEVSKSVEEK